MTAKRKPHATGGSVHSPASLRNLIPGGTTAPPGNSRAMTHGGKSKALVADVSAEVAELAAAIAEIVPVKDADGSAPAADTLALEACAVTLKRWRSVRAYNALHGELDAKGNVKASARLENELKRAFDRDLHVLGLNPVARAQLGLTLAQAQSFDLARHWQEQGGDDA